MYQVSEETKIKVYKTFDRNEEMVNDDVEIIKTWMKTQHHLPEMMEDVKIKNFLNLNKFSIEKTKEKIDMYYSIRSIIPDMFEKSNPKLDNIKRVFDTTYMSTFPTLLDGTHRVYFSKLKKSNTLNPMDLSNLWFAIFEIRLYEDFMVDDVIIFDFGQYSLGDIQKVTPTLVTKFLAVYKKVYALRLHKLIYFNCPSFVSVVTGLLRSVMKPKIFERVQFHQGDAIVKEMFSKDVLPKDYGGDGPSLDELNVMMKRKLAEYQDRFDQLDKLRVNENLRPAKLDNDEILGFYGSFKKISVD